MKKGSALLHSETFRPRHPCLPAALATDLRREISTLTRVNQRLGQQQAWKQGLINALVAMCASTKLVMKPWAGEVSCRWSPIGRILEGYQLCREVFRSNRITGTTALSDDSSVLVNLHWHHCVDHLQCQCLRVNYVITIHRLFVIGISWYNRFHGTLRDILSWILIQRDI